MGSVAATILLCRALPHLCRAARRERPPVPLPRIVRVCLSYQNKLRRASSACGCPAAEMVERHKRARELVSDEVVDAFMAVRPMTDLYG